MPDTIVAPRPSAVAGVKQALYRSSALRFLYARARNPFDRREGAKVFSNADAYARALYEKADGQVVLQTRDGLRIAIRRNRWDAEIVREIFFRQPYTRHTTVGPAPVVIDIGGYIGDFTLYALSRLDASRVIVYEPTLENFQLVQQNVALNGFEDRTTVVNAAVGLPGELTLFVQKDTADEIHASSYWYEEHEHRTVPSFSLEQVFETHDVDLVDLLKVDCEGGEYDILGDVPNALLDRIANVVFEYHEVDGFRPKLEHVLNRLSAAGFTLHRAGHIVSARRA